MTDVVRVHQTGGPEVLKFEQAEVGAPGPGQALIRQTASGSTTSTSISAPASTRRRACRSSPGKEGAGVVEAVGEGVSEVKVGAARRLCRDRSAPMPSARWCRPTALVGIPDGITDEQAAAMMLKGMTAQYLLRRTYLVKPGDTILFHAAAGGVGLIAVPVGEAPRRHRDRHGRQRGEGRARAGRTAATT